MSAQTGVAAFENARWARGDQTLEFRHRAALELVAGPKALDLGCGDGLFLALLKEAGVEACGLDLSEEAVRACRAKGLGAERYELGKTLPYADGAFDTVTLLDVLEHVYEPLALLREAARVGKRVVVSVPNFSSLPARLQALAGAVPENNRPSKGHVYWFNRRVLLALAAEAALTPREWRMNTFFPCSLMPRFVTGVSPSLFALSFVVRLEKRDA